MRFAVIMLCSVFLQSVSLNCSFAQTTSAQMTSTHLVEDELPANESVKIERMQWHYARKDDKNASAAITVFNYSDKKIKRINFSVIATDKSGLVLESEGFSIKRLVATDTVDPNTSKTFTFQKAFQNDQIARLEVSNAIVEYENGSIDIIQK
jgi:hypothetical protein